MDQLNANIKPLKRNYLPTELKVDSWEDIAPYFKDLSERKIDSVADLKKWLSDTSELEALLEEDICWRQIKTTTDTNNKEYRDSFVKFVSEIQPKIQPFAFELNQKLAGSPYTKELNQEEYLVYLRKIKNSIELFREENIPIQSELSVLQQEYGTITGQMSVEVNGKTYTLQQARKFLEHPDRKVREDVYRKVNDRRLEDKEKLDDLFNQLIKKRNQEALNAGFDNYRDYKFKQLDRFDYTKEDCFAFHEGVKKYVLPLVNEIYELKRKKLGVATLRPWDLDAEPVGIEPLFPFETGDELVDKAIEVFTRLKPFFGECLRKMKEMGRLDLESRNGKAPGGYNMPLAETGAPFIFMNAAGRVDDVITIMHEGGHAIQSFLTHPLELNAFKEYPMEIAEVASMSMELFSMDHWDIFFSDPEELRRAKIYELERVITLFPWIALIDKFQHWIYTHPSHSNEERKAAWVAMFHDFTSPVIDYSGLEEAVAYQWQKQLHLYEVPFYYIEYGIAQLGAIGLWKEYTEDKENALNNYIHALSLGATKTLPETYRAAGLEFSFSPEHMHELMGFVKEKLTAISD